MLLSSDIRLRTCGTLTFSRGTIRRRKRTHCFQAMDHADARQSRKGSPNEFAEKYCRLQICCLGE